MNRILSLGAGVQSTVVFLMSCRGELPRLDCAIFADVGWEPKAVYDHLEWLKKKASIAEIPIHVVTAGNIKQDALESQVRGTKGSGYRWASMPYRTVDIKGKQGMIRRQCTSEYKIQPIEKFLRREVINLKPKQHAPKHPVIAHWFGISTDEIQRAKDSRNKWSYHYYPLIEMNMTRKDCIDWLESNYPHRTVPRSACIACPYRSNEEWRNLQETSPDEWREAIEFDKAIRNCGGMRGKMYIHRDCKPLGEVDIRTAEEAGQTNMFINECEGMCGV